MVSMDIAEMMKVVPSRRTGRKTCTSATSPTTSPIRNFLGLNTGLIFDRPWTNRPLGLTSSTLGSIRFSYVLLEKTYYFYYKSEFVNIVEGHKGYYYYYYYYYWYSALGPVWVETRIQSGDWYGSGTLHPGQVLRGSLPLLSPAFYMFPLFTTRYLHDVRDPSGGSGNCGREFCPVILPK